MNRTEVRDLMVIKEQIRSQENEKFVKFAKTYWKKFDNFFANFHCYTLDRLKTFIGISERKEIFRPYPKSKKYLNFCKIPPDFLYRGAVP